MANYLLLLIIVISVGIQTTISVYTIYLYGVCFLSFNPVLLVTTSKAIKKKDKSIIVTCALLVLLATSIANLAIQWKLINLCFIYNGQSMLSAFTCGINGFGTGYSMASAIFIDLQCIIADGLLVMFILANNI